MLADSLVKIALETQEERGPYRPRPSLAGPERCIRSLVYYAAGVRPAPFPGRAIFVFDDGDWHEQLVKEWIRQSAFQLHSEQMRVETPVGPGEIDGILTDLLRMDRLLEVKSANPFSYERWWRGQYPLDYFTQVALYLAGLQKIAPELTEAILLAKNKATAALMEFLLAYDAEADRLRLLEIVRSDGQHNRPDFAIERVTRAAVEKFAEVERYRAANTLPIRPFSLGTDYPCGWCSWAGPCWGSFEEEFERMISGAVLPEEIVRICAEWAVAHGAAKDMKDEAKTLKERIEAMIKEHDQDLADACGYWFQADLDAGRLQGKADDLKQRIRNYLYREGVRMAVGGEYRATLALRKRTAYSVEATQYEELRVVKVPPKPEKRVKPKGAADGEADAGPGRPGAGEPDR